MFRTSQHTAYAFDDFITSEHILLHLQNDKKITNWYAERYLTMTGQCRPTQSFKNINLLVQSINVRLIFCVPFSFSKNPKSVRVFCIN